MVSAALITTLIVMLFLKAPVIIAMGASAAVGCWLSDMPMYLIAQGVVDGAMAWNLLALFFFNINTPGVRITIPLGAIIYWCIRRKVLWKSAARTRTPVSYKPFEENPRPTQWQYPPPGPPQEPGKQ